MKRTLAALTAILMMFAFAMAEPDEGKFIRTEAPGQPWIAAGKQIAPEDITDFYYTVDASTDPPHYQRYRFYTENGAYWFCHETREGGGWPQTEADITASGLMQLSEDEWNAFFTLIAGGEVRNREEDLNDGDSGPWTFMYWNGDQGTMQEYSFISYEARLNFEAFCEALAAQEQSSK